MDTIKSGNRPEDTWGDEDQGIMGAWNVLVSIGLFSATGASEKPARYQITAPLFDRITLRLHPDYAGTHELVITCAGLDPASISYVESASFNGEPLASPTSRSPASMPAES